MNFRQMMKLAPLNDERLILQQNDYNEVVDIAALRKVELDKLQKEYLQLQKEFNKLQKEYDKLKKSSDVYENIAFSRLQELEDENEQLKLSLMTAYKPKR